MPNFADLIDSIVKLTFLSGNGCSFYTIKLKGETKTEFEKFIEITKIRSEESSVFKSQTGLLITLLKKIAISGAEEFWFRHEAGGSLALPVHEKIKGLPAIRLYNMRLSSQVIILYGGDFKTTLNPEDCPNVVRHFSVAKNVTPILDSLFRKQGIIEPSLYLNGNQIVSNDDEIIIEN
jgi:hypothetical protein